MHAPQLTEELFLALLDDSIPTLDLCRQHELNIEQLRAIIEGPQYQSLIDSVEIIEHGRTRARAPGRAALALQAIEHIAAQEPSSPVHAETVRKAASFLHRTAQPPAAPPAPPDEIDPQPPNTPEPSPDQSTDRATSSSGCPDSPSPAQSGSTASRSTNTHNHKIPPAQARAPPRARSITPVSRRSSRTPAAGA